MKLIRKSVSAFFQPAGPLSQGGVQTRLALLWLSLAGEPLLSLYTLLPFILRKNLGASMFQISLFIMLRPVLSVFSFYWSSAFKVGKSPLITNIILAFFLAYLPFLFFPWCTSFWFLLFAAATYQLFSKAALPALIEVIRRTLPKKPREAAYSLFFILGFVESGVLGICFGKLMDQKVLDWRMLFFFSALAGLSTLFLLRRISLKQESSQSVEPKGNPLIQPLKESARLLDQRKDFAQFQWTFMLGGSALMLMAPALSSYYAETLELTYTDMATARFVFMAMGVVGSSFLWKRGLSRTPMLKLLLLILCGFALFPVALFCAQIDLFFLYLAFFLYGIAQAGSHLVWNLSGTLFSREQDSIPFTRTNVLMAGCRGAVIPLLGAFLCDAFGAPAVLALSFGVVCFGMGYVLSKLRPSLAV